jgi:hypothetical protein
MQIHVPELWGEAVRVMVYMFASLIIVPDQAVAVGNEFRRAFPLEKVGVFDAMEFQIAFSNRDMFGMWQEHSYQNLAILFMPPQDLKGVMVTGLDNALQFWF